MVTTDIAQRRQPDGESEMLSRNEVKPLVAKQNRVTEKKKREAQLEDIGTIYGASKQGTSGLAMS